MGGFLDNFKPIVNRSPPLTDAQLAHRRRFRRRLPRLIGSAVVVGLISVVLGRNDLEVVAVTLPAGVLAVWAFYALTLRWEHGPPE